MNRIGEVYISNEGYNMTIVKYIDVNNCSVILEDSNILNNLTYHNIIRGNIKNPFHKSVYGVGYFGVGKYYSSVESKPTISYQIWSDMLRRCYSEKYHLKKPTYIGCSVYPEWHNFQVFAEWFKNNYIEDWHLDKDILFKGNKVYSPETCSFVPQEINALLIKTDSKRGLYPIGVTKRANKFESNCSIQGKLTYLGQFKTYEEAFESYRKVKELYIKQAAEKYKHQITEACYEALINYKVEITD